MRCRALVLAMLLASTSAHAEGAPSSNAHAPTVAGVADERGGISTELSEASAPAESPVAVAPAKKLSAGRRALAIGAAIFPGFVLRGAGSWVAGEKRAAVRLAGGAAGGLVLAGIGGGLVGGSNGNPYTMPAVPLVVAGVGGILTSWVEDIWIAAGGAAVHAGPRPPATWTLEVGETWQHDAYRERIYQRVAATAERGRFQARTSGLLSFTRDAWLVFADVRARVLGDAACATCLRVRAGGRLQRDRDDMVTQLVGEVEVEGRLGLARFDRAFHSTFVELSTGLGANRITYASMTSEVESLMLGRFAWGAYVPGGEITLYYDHRRDGLAGGIDAWRASGFMGSFGATADIGVGGAWSLRGEFQLGNAYLTTLALTYRGGQ